MELLVICERCGEPIGCDGIKKMFCETCRKLGMDLKYCFIRDHAPYEAKGLCIWCHYQQLRKELP